MEERLNLAESFAVRTIHISHCLQEIQGETDAAAAPKDDCRNGVGRHPVRRHIELLSQRSAYQASQSSDEREVQNARNEQDNEETFRMCTSTSSGDHNKDTGEFTVNGFANVQAEIDGGQ